LTSLTLRFAKIYYQKRFNDRSNGFPFGQQPVCSQPLRGADLMIRKQVIPRGEGNVSGTAEASGAEAIPRLGIVWH
jgi:hypothetical protein